MLGPAGTKLPLSPPSGSGRGPGCGCAWASAGGPASGSECGRGAAARRSGPAAATASGRGGATASAAGVAAGSGCCAGGAGSGCCAGAAGSGCAPGAAGCASGGAEGCGSGGEAGCACGPCGSKGQQRSESVAPLNRLLGSTSRTTTHFQRGMHAARLQAGRRGPRLPEWRPYLLRLRLRRRGGERLRLPS